MRGMISRCASSRAHAIAEPVDAVSSPRSLQMLLSRITCVTSEIPTFGPKKRAWAGASHEASAVGVAQLDRVPLFVGVFQTRGATALVFRGDDGLDELTTTGHSHIWEVSRGLVTEHDLDPRDLGIPLVKMSELIGGDPEHNAGVVRRVLGGEKGAVRDIVLLNAAAGLVAYRLAEDPAQMQVSILDRFAAQLEVAREALDSGKAAAKLEQWVSGASAGAVEA